jgi:hypothetical protein
MDTKRRVIKETKRMIAMTGLSMPGCRVKKKSGSGRTGR